MSAAEGLHDRPDVEFRTRALSMVGLFAALLLPSLSIVLSGGAAVTVTYVIAGAAWIVVMISIATPRLDRLPARGAMALAGAVLVLLALATAFIHPVIDVNGFTVLGHSVGASDADNAVDQGIAALLDGRNPYDERTFLGQPPGPLPGAFLLGLPFYALGNAAFASVFFLAVFWGLASIRPSSPQSGTALLLLVLTASPVVIYETLTGTDHLIDGVAVVALSAAVILLTDRPGWCLIAAAALGVAMATRANLALLLVPLVAVVAARAGRWRSVAVALSTCASFLAVSLPFYLRDPEAFTPLSAGVGKVDDIPFGGLLVPVAGLVVALALWRLPHRGLRDFYRDAFVIQFAVITLATAWQYRVGSPLADNFWTYGVMYLVPGALFSWQRYHRTSERPGHRTAGEKSAPAGPTLPGPVARPAAE